MAEKCPKCGARRVGSMMLPDASGDMFECVSSLAEDGTFCQSFGCQHAENAQLRKKLAILDDGALAERVAADCHDKLHDELWCRTCEARRDAIAAYREALKEAAK